MDPFDNQELDLDEIAERLADPDSQIRRVAVMELGEAADPAALTLLTDRLADDDTTVREAAARALESFTGDAAAVPALIAAL